MLIKAIALFLILNSVYLASESKSLPVKEDPNWWKKGECLVIKDHQGYYLTVGGKDYGYKLILSEKYNTKRSTFRIVPSDINQNTYYIQRCEAKKIRPIAWSDMYAKQTNNYYVYDKDFPKNVEYANKWRIVSQPNTKFVQIVNSQSRKPYNLFASTSKENGYRLALVYGAEWSSDPKKRFWAIEKLPGKNAKPFENAQALAGEGIFDEEDDETTESPVDVTDDNDFEEIETTPDFSDDDATKDSEIALDFEEENTTPSDSEEVVTADDQDVATTESDMDSEEETESEEMP